MNKILTVILIYCVSLSTLAAPPVAVNGEQSSNVFVQNLKLPNYQATKQAGLDTRIETGNTNILINPSFEHSTVTTGWTISNATATADTTNQVDGKKALSLSLTGALSVTQDSTVNAANLVGLQGVARIKIKTSDVDGLQVCARNAGVTSTSLCVSVPKDGAWKEINVPYVLTATSNGIAITSTGTTGTVKLDDAFVGTSAPFQNVNGARLIGSMTISGCSWAVNNSGSLTGLGTTTGCTYTGTGLLTSPSTIIDGFKLNQQLDAGTIMIVYRGQNTLSNLAGSGSTQIAVNDGTTTTTTIQQYGYSANTSQTFTAVSSGTFKFTYSASIPSGTTYQLYQRNVEGGTFTAASNQTWEVYYYPPDSKIYSQASQDISWQACTFSTLAWQGLGTVTNNLLCARERGNLKIKGKFTTGTTSASLGQIPLPTNFGTISIASNIQSNSIAGTVFVENASTGVFESLLISPSATVIRHSNALINTAINPSVAVNGSAAFANSVVVSFNGEISIPIQGWQDYGVIVGSFAGLEKCANDYECTDSFSAYLTSSTNVISNQNIPWLSSCTGTATKTCTFNTNLKDGTSALSSPMNCSVISVAGNATSEMQIEPTSSSTQLVFTSYTSGGVATQSFGWHIKCQKGTNDYKPKTAKVATSIGVPTVPGISTSGTGNSIDTFSVSFGATASTPCTAASTNCAYNDTIGTTGNYVFRTASAGTYTLFLNKTYAKLKCTGNAVGASTITLQPIYCSSSCSSTSIIAQNSQTGSSVDVYGTIYCQGSY